MKKHLSCLLITMLFLLIAATFTACAIFNGGSGNGAESGKDEQIFAVYTAYAEGGGTLSYDDWLATIKGESGAAGVGILSIEKTSTDGLVDTYTVTLTNGVTSTFTIKNGAPGKDGTDGKDGVNGTDGKDGKDGVNGTDGITPTIGDNGHWFIGEVDTGIVAVGQNGQDGNDGKDGKDGKDGQDGKDGKDGQDGKDGKDGVTPTVSINEDGYWVINGEVSTVKAKGENGAPGQDGKDGKDGQDGAPGNDGKDGKDGEDGQDGKDGKDGNGIASIQKTATDGLTDTYTITFTDGTSVTFVVKNGADGKDGANGSDGAPGKDGVDGKDGQDGQNGSDGQDGKDGLTPYIGDNGHWFIGTVDTGVVAAGQNGQDGKDGQDGAPGQNGQDGRDGVDGKDGQDGKDGTDGKDGNGIASIQKTATDGLIDTYTITFTDGSTTTFTVKNGADGKDGNDGTDGQNGQDGLTPTIGENGHWFIGGVDTGVVAVGQNGQDGRDGTDGQDGSNGQDGKGISSIEKTSSEGLVDFYTITFTDGGTMVFTVKNGADGKDSQDVQQAITPTIGDNGHWFIGGVDTGVVAVGQNGQDGKDGQDGAPGKDGVDGKDGENGQNGADGQDGKDGLTPYIGDNGHWFIGDVDTGVIAVGQNGADGADGNGIASIQKTATDGLIDTYTITFTDGSTTTFVVKNGADGADGQNGADGAPGQDGKDGENGKDGIDGKDGADGQDGKDGLTPYIGDNGHWFIGDIDTGVMAAGQNGQDGAPGQNGQDGAPGQDGADGKDGQDGKDGNGIASIQKTATDGLIDTYTITFTDGSTTTFVVKNGADGADGQNGVDGAPGKDGVDGKDGANGQNGADGQDGKDGLTPYIGDNGHWFIGDVDTGVIAVGQNGADGAPGQDGKDGENGQNGADGQDGKDGLTPTITINEDGYWVINGEVTNVKARGEDGTPGQNGADGQDGKDGLTPYIGDNGHWFIGDIDTGVVAVGQNGQDGKDGVDGKDGQDGAPGQNGQDGKDGLTPYIGDNGHWFIGDIDTGVVAVGQNGQDGAPGQDGADGKDGQDGKDGADGKDGNGIASIQKTATDGLVDTYTITFTDGSTTTFTVTNGADGKDGKDGKDGADGAAVTPTDLFRFALTDGGTYRVSARYMDMPIRTVIPDQYEGKAVTEIAAGAFNGRESVDEIVLPLSVVKIGSNAFADREYPLTVYYLGSAADREGIDGKDQVAFDSWFFYSEQEPTTAGQYWHYDGEGRILVWAAVIVPEAPILTASATGISWEAVQHATTYNYSYDGVTWSQTQGLTVPFRDEAGNYTLSVRAMNGKIVGEASSFSYTEKAVALSALSVSGRTVSWTSTNKTLSLSVNGTAKTPTQSGTSYSFTCSATANTYAISVTAAGGYDANDKIWYYGDSIQKSASVTVAKLATPTISTPSDGATTIGWSAVTGATAYEYSTNGGSSWKSTTERSVALSATTGSNKIRVRATSSDLTKLTSNASSDFTYTTTAIALSDITFQGITANWTATGRLTYVKEGDGEYVVTNLSSYTLTSTSVGEHVVGVKVVGGYSSGVFYSGGEEEKSASVTISKLAAPTINTPANGTKKVYWTDVTGATGYQYSTNGGTSWTSTTSTSVDLSATAGSNNIRVRATSSDPTKLTSDASSDFTYTTVAVSLSNITFQGVTANWTAVGYMTYYKEGDGEYVATDSDFHTLTSRSEGDHTIWVKVTNGYSQGNKTYYGGNWVEKSATVTISKLDTPTISTPSDGATTIGWSAVTGATAYEYSTNGGTSWTSTKSTSVALSATTGSNKIRVRATSSSGTKLTSDASSDFTYTTAAVSLSAVTFEGKRAKWVASARSVYVREGSGSYNDTTLNYYDLTDLSEGSKTVSVKAYNGYDASTNIFYSGNATTESATRMVQRADKTITFEEQTANSVYSVENGGTDAANWTQEYWNSSSEGWVTTSKQMNSRAGDAGRVVNFSTSTTKGRFTYSTGSSLGLANAFSVRFGNYYTAYDIWYKIMLIDTAGKYHYLAGATNKSVMFPSTGTNNSNKVFTTVSYVGFDPIEVSAIKFEVYGSTGSSSTYCYFYVDDITLTYVEPDLGTAATYSRGDFTVSSGGSVTKTFNTEGAADALNFTLKNNGTSTAAYADVTVYDGDYMVATGRYVLAASDTQSFNLIFNKWHVTKFTVTANNAQIKISGITLGTSDAYAVTKHDEYRVEATSGSTSILLMGEEVKSTATVNYNLTAIKQLQKYADDVSPLFASIVNVKQILSATYSQSIDVMSNAGSSNTYGTLTIKYVVSDTNAVTTSTITVKKKDSASLNEATRDAYSRNLWKEISLDPHQVILAGSSSMEKWERVGQDMKGIQFADVGIGGTVSTDWSKSGGLAERLIYAYNPRAVILFVGVNDLKGGKTLANTLTDVQSLLTQIHTKLPGAKVYYVLINKVPLAISSSNYLTVANVTSFNNSMTTYANNYDWLTTIALDTDKHMVYNGGNGYDFNYNSTTNAYDKSSNFGKTSFFDSMHLNQAGYTEWAYVIRNKFLALDKKKTWTKTD